MSCTVIVLLRESFVSLHLKWYVCISWMLIDVCGTTSNLRAICCVVIFGGKVTKQWDMPARAEIERWQSVSKTHYNGEKEPQYPYEATERGHTQNEEREENRGEKKGCRRGVVF